MFVGVVLDSRELTLVLIITSDTDRGARADSLMRDWPGLRVDVAVGPVEIAARHQATSSEQVVVEFPVPEENPVRLFCATISRIHRVRRDHAGPLAFVPGAVPDVIADCARADDPWEVCHVLGPEGDLAYLHLGSAVVQSRLLPDFCSAMLERPVSACSFVRLLEATQTWR